MKVLSKQSLFSAFADGLRVLRGGRAAGWQAAGLERTSGAAAGEASRGLQEHRDNRRGQGTCSVAPGDAEETGELTHSQASAAKEGASRRDSSFSESWKPLKAAEIEVEGQIHAARTPWKEVNLFQILLFYFLSPLV